MHLKQTIWLAAAAAVVFCCPIEARADSCGINLNTSPTCFTVTNVVDVDYGTLTLLSSTGSLISTTNIVTAEDILSPFDTTPPGVPAAFVALFPGLVTQLQADPQSTYADFPSFLFTGLTSLADSNGFGLPGDPSTVLNSPADPMAAAFDAQLADVGGPYVTLSDTGYQTQPFSQAGCDYENSFFPSPPACTGPTLGSEYTFTYVLGPQTIDGGSYTSFVNFQIYSRDVTEQLTATPEPRLLLALGLAFGALVLLRFRANDGRASG